MLKLTLNRTLRFIKYADAKFMDFSFIIFYSPCVALRSISNNFRTGMAFFFFSKTIFTVVVVVLARLTENFKCRSFPPSVSYIIKRNHVTFQTVKMSQLWTFQWKNVLALGHFINALEHFISIPGHCISKMAQHMIWDIYLCGMPCPSI